MARKIIGSSWDRKSLDNHNDNYEQLFKKTENAPSKDDLKKISDKVDTTDEHISSLSVDSNGVEYEQPKNAIDMMNAKMLSQLDLSKSATELVENKLVVNWQLGLIDERTGIANLSPYSVKFHSENININKNQMAKIVVKNNLNGIIFYFKNNEYVKKSGYFTDSINVIGEDSFDTIKIMCGFRDNTTINTVELFLKATTSVDIFRNAQFSLNDQFNQISNANGLRRLKFNFGNSIDIPSKYGEQVNLSGNLTGLFNTSITDCVAGDIFLISGTGGVNPRLWSFLDRDNKVISMSKSSLTLDSRHVVAPINAKKLVINDNSSSISYRIDNLSVKNEITLNQDTLTVGAVDIGKFKIGEKADTSTKYNVDFSSIVLPVETNDIIRLNGSGGSNPRFYALLDAELRVLELSDVFFTSRHENYIKVIPENARYLVFNSNLKTPYKPEITLIPVNIEKNKDISKDRAVDQRNIPITMDMANFTNGIKFKEQLENPKFILKMDSEGDIMAHCSSFRIVDDVVYSSFYVNKIRHFEDPREQTAVLRIRNLDGTGETKNATVADIGDMIPEGKIDAIYDTVVLTELNDIRVVFTARVNGQYYLLYKIYNKNNNSFSEVKHCQFSYANSTEVFSINGMKKVLKENNIYFPYFDSDVSYMQKLTPRVENGETWWYLGLGVLEFCFIAKTKDLVNYHYVSQPTFEHTNMYEPSVYVKGDNVFWLCRQSILANYPYAHLSKYNLITGEWSDPVKILDCQSRSDFFEFKGTLYAVHAPFDRNHLTVTQINSENLSMSFPIQTAYINNLFYPFVQNYKDKLYMTITQNRNYVQFLEFSLNGFGIGQTIELFKNLMS